MKKISMKNWVALFAVIVLVLSVKPMYAATTNVTGAWTGDVSSPNGDFPLTFHLKQDGTKLTGTVDGPQGDPMPIANGKVDGNKVSFTVSFNGTTITHKGTVDGDKMTMTTTSDGQMPPMSLTLTREKTSSGQ
jgi:hypothetical protein